MNFNRKLIFICGGSDCKKCGSKELRKEIQRETKIGELKGSCKIIRTKCMDFCKSGPVIIVGEQIIKKATSQKVFTQLKKS